VLPLHQKSFKQAYFSNLFSDEWDMDQEYLLERPNMNLPRPNMILNKHMVREIRKLFEEYRKRLMLIKSKFLLWAKAYHYNHNGYSLIQ